MSVPPRVLPPQRTHETIKPQPDAAMQPAKFARPGCRAPSLLPATEFVNTASATDGDATIPLPSKVPPLRLFFEAWQPIAILSPEGRLEGFEGSAQVAITLRPLKHQEMRVAAGLKQQQAESVVPLQGRIDVHAVQFDTVSHRTLPLDPTVDLSSFDQLLADSKRGVAVYSRLKQLYAEVRKMSGDDLLANEDAALRITSDTKANPVDPVTTLRAANDAASTRALEVLRSMLGAKLMDGMLQEKISLLAALTADVKSAQREHLDRERADLHVEQESIPDRRKALMLEEKQMEDLLTAERDKLKLWEEAFSRKWNEQSETYRALERLQTELAERLKAAQAALARASRAEMSRPNSPAPHSRPSSPTPGASPTRMMHETAETKQGKTIERLMQQVATLKEQVERNERKHAQMKKSLIDAPSKQRSEQALVIHGKEKAHKRAVEANSVILKQLDERAPVVAQLILDNQNRRVQLEINFRGEMTELVNFDRVAVERMINNNLLNSLRATGGGGLRRYAIGQELMACIPAPEDPSSLIWCDATVVSAEPSSFVHLLRLKDGQEITKALYCFNHAPKLLACAQWDILRARYSLRLHEQSCFLVDPFTGRTFDVLQHCLDLVWITPQPERDEICGEKGISVRELSSMLQATHAATCTLSEKKLRAPLCLLLTGPAAVGKTTALRQLTTLALAQPHHLVPIFVRAVDMQRSLDCEDHRSKFESAWNWVDAHLQVCHESADGGLATYAMLRQAMMCRRALILLDGVDEAGSESEHIKRHIVDVLQPQGHWLVVTSREAHGYPETMHHIRMELLSDEQQHKLMKQRLGDGPLYEQMWTYAAQRKKTFGDSHSLFTSSPPLLMMLISIYEARILCLPEEDPHEEEEVLMPLTTSELFGLMVNTVLDRLSSEHPDAPYMKTLLLVAAFYAHANLQKTISADILERAAKSLLQPNERSLTGGLLRSLQRIMALALQDQLPLLALCRAEPFEVQFAHVSLQEYCFGVAACQGHRLPKKSSKPWQWSSWWLDALALGKEMGDHFGAGLLHGCWQGSARSGQLSLAGQVGTKPSNDEPTELSVPTGEKPSAAEGRIIPILALELLSRSCHTLDLQHNQLTSHEVKSLARGFQPRWLKSLTLSQNALGCRGIEAVMSVFLSEENGGALQYLEVADCNFGLKGTLAIAQYLSISTSLELLDIRGNDPTDDGLRTTGRALLKNEASALDWLRCDAFDLSPGITELSLHPFLDAAPLVVLLAGVLRHDSSADILETVKIYDANAGVEGGSALALAMRINRTMVALTLSNMQLGDEGIIALSSGLKHHSTIKTLDLSCNGMTERAAKTLATNLRGCTALTTLVLEKNRICDVGVKSVVEVCSTLDSLTTLNVVSNSISTPGFKSLAALICSNPGITQLDAIGNDLRGDGIGAMGNALNKSKKSLLSFVRLDAFELTKEVTELRLRGRDLVAGVAPLLTGLLVRNNILTTIDLQSNGLGPTGAAALVDGIAASPSLTSLNLAHNFIKPDGLKALGRALRLSKHLARLDVSNNQVCGVDGNGMGKHTLVGVKALAVAVGQSRLVALNLAGNGLEVDGAKTIAPALASCTTLLEIGLADNNVTFFGADPSGLEQLILFARSGAPEEVTGPNEARKLDLTDNHLNRRAWALRNNLAVYQRKGRNLVNTSVLHIEAQPCACHYCQVNDMVVFDQLAPKRRPASSPASHATQQAAINGMIKDAASRASSVLAKSQGMRSAKQ